MHLVDISSIKIAKSIFGQPDELWPSEQPRYGNIVASRFEEHPISGDNMNLPLAAGFAFREYIHGNSRAVSDWEVYLNKYLDTMEGASESKLPGVKRGF